MIVEFFFLGFSCFQWHKEHIGRAAILIISKRKKKVLRLLRPISKTTPNGHEPIGGRCDRPGR